MVQIMYPVFCSSPSNQTPPPKLNALFFKVYIDLYDLSVVCTVYNIQAILFSLIYLFQKQSWERNGTPEDKTSEDSPQVVVFWVHLFTIPRLTNLFNLYCVYRKYSIVYIFNCFVDLSVVSLLN